MCESCTMRRRSCVASLVVLLSVHLLMWRSVLSVKTVSNSETVSVSSIKTESTISSGGDFIALASVFEKEIEIFNVSLGLQETVDLSGLLDSNRYEWIHHPVKSNSDRVFFLGREKESYHFTIFAVVSDGQGNFSSDPSTVFSTGSSYVSMDCADDRLLHATFSTPYTSIVSRYWDGNAWHSSVLTKMKNLWIVNTSDKYAVTHKLLGDDLYVYELDPGAATGTSFQNISLGFHIEFALISGTSADGYHFVVKPYDERKLLYYQLDGGTFVFRMDIVDIIPQAYSGDDFDRRVQLTPTMIAMSLDSGSALVFHRYGTQAVLSHVYEENRCKDVKASGNLVLLQTASPLDGNFARYYMSVGYPGCDETSAVNFNTSANVNDGSCVLGQLNITSPSNMTTISGDVTLDMSLFPVYATLVEESGYNGTLWYSVDPTCHTAGNDVSWKEITSQPPLTILAAELSAAGGSGTRPVCAAIGRGIDGLMLTGDDARDTTFMDWSP
eukprot:TRINITY_DN69402_c6_g1_i1.p1 TRINITY_DN69402_c6_g1~~TRINITY_DN69402_c6_g1_i1.p1  ORF type:complete len:498 (+),score=95.59 TRINITY_DN69402_c6_g1_i1:82-1575(+)